MNPARSLGPAVVMWAWLKDKDDAGQWMDVDKLWDDHWVKTLIFLNNAKC